LFFFTWQMLCVIDYYPMVNVNTNVYHCLHWNFGPLQVDYEKEIVTIKKWNLHLEKTWYENHNHEYNYLENLKTLH
jgi:hypothetical protein